MLSPLKAVLFVVSAAALGGGGAALALALRDQPDDPSPAAARSIVDTAGRALAASLTDAGTAASLDEFVAAGRSAQRRAIDVRALGTKVSRLPEPAYRSAARAAVDAHIAALTSIASLASAERSTAATRRRLVEDAASSQSALERAARAWPRPENPRAAVATPAVVRVDSTAATVAKRLRTIERRLRRWRLRVAQVKRARRAAVGVLDSYASSFRSHHRTYQKLRDATEAFIAKTDRSGSTFDDAYEFLGGAISDRARVRRALDALDPPGSVAGAHNRVLAALDTAIEAMGDAYDGIVDYQFDDGEYSSYKETPGWRRFAEKSDALAGTYAANFADWERRVARARRAITNKPMPRRPEV